MLKLYIIVYYMLKQYMLNQWGTEGPPRYPLLQVFSGSITTSITTSITWYLQASCSSMYLSSIIVVVCI